MATKPEGRVKRAANKILKDYGVYSFMPVTSGFGRSGIGDEIACVNGTFVSIEYKATNKGKPTALQNMDATSVMNSGGVALLIHKDNLDYLELVISVLTRDKPISCDERKGLSNWPEYELPEVEI